MDGTKAWTEAVGPRASDLAALEGLGYAPIGWPAPGRIVWTLDHRATFRQRVVCATFDTNKYRWVYYPFCGQWVGDEFPTASAAHVYAALAEWGNQGAPVEELFGERFKRTFTG